MSLPTKVTGSGRLPGLPWQGVPPPGSSHPKAAAPADPQQPGAAAKPRRRRGGEAPRPARAGRPGFGASGSPPPRRPLSLSPVPGAGWAGRHHWEPIGASPSDPSSPVFTVSAVTAQAQRPSAGWSRTGGSRSGRGPRSPAVAARPGPRREAARTTPAPRASRPPSRDCRRRKRRRRRRRRKGAPGRRRENRREPRSPRSRRRRPPAARAWRPTGRRREPPTTWTGRPVPRAPRRASAAGTGIGGCSAFSSWPGRPPAPPPRTPSADPAGPASPCEGSARLCWSGISTRSTAKTYLRKRLLHPTPPWSLSPSHTETTARGASFRCPLPLPSHTTIAWSRPRPSGWSTPTRCPASPVSRQVTHPSRSVLPSPPPSLSSWTSRCPTTQKATPSSEKIKKTALLPGLCPWGILILGAEGQTALLLYGMEGAGT